MVKLLSIALAILLLLVGSAPSRAQHKPEIIERGKKATALVEVVTAKGRATGSAFCVDKSGLFITNSHVVEGAAGSKGDVRAGGRHRKKTDGLSGRRSLRADDHLDLALLKVDAESGLMPLELGRDDAWT